MKIIALFALTLLVACAHKPMTTPPQQDNLPIIDTHSHTNFSGEIQAVSGIP